MTEGLFGGVASAGPESGTVRVLITVKAAPNPSAHHGETVCVAGIRVHDDGSESWMRLYPVNFRALEQDLTFAKYDVVQVGVTPVDGRGGDNRLESHRPNMNSLHVETHLKTWEQRAPWVEPMVSGDACGLGREAASNSQAPSLALVRPAEVMDLEVARHPGWTSEERAKIDAYVNQLTLFGDESKSPLEAPRFKGWYRYRCHASEFGGHRQQVIDWEFVALQRKHAGDPDDAVREALRARFLDMMCSRERAPAFYPGESGQTATGIQRAWVLLPQEVDASLRTYRPREPRPGIGELAHAMGAFDATAPPEE